MNELVQKLIQAVQEFIAGFMSATSDEIAALRQQVQKNTADIAALKQPGSGGGDPGPIDPPTNPGEIFIFQFDGNNNDDDDIAALPISALYAYGAGLAPVMSFFYNNNRDENDVAWQVEAMRKSAAFAEKLGIKTYDYAADEAGTLSKLVELLSSGAKVTSFEGGPMGTIYRALEATPVEFHKNIKLVSHSQWNENRDNSGQNKKWNALKEKFPQVTYIDINDQNAGFFSDDWNWLDAAENPTLKEARALMYNAQAKVNDASDSGMLFWYLTGNENGNVFDAASWLRTWFPDGASRSSFTEPEPGLLMAQAENFDISGTGFEMQADVAGFSGSGYITFTAPDSFQDLPPGPFIEEFFTPTKSGTYQLQIHNRADDPNDPSQGNDTWVFINGERFYADDNGTPVFAKGNQYGETNVTATNDSADGFLKFYSNASGEWTMQTSAIDNRPRQIMVELEAGKQYLFQLAGRSNGHSVDVVFLRHVDHGPAVINKYLGQPGPGPIDPPTNPDLGSVEIVPQSAVIAGQTVVMEAVVSSSLNVAQVDFYLNGSKDSYKTEKSYRYEAPTQVPGEPFTVTVVVQFTTGDKLTKTATFEPSGGSDPGTGGGGGGGVPIDPQPIDPVGIEEFDTFVNEASGTYYTVDADTQEVRVMTEPEVEALFNTANVHMGKPDNRCRIEAVPGLPGRKAFTFIMNNQSGGFSDRFSTHKTNGLAAGDIDYYPDAKALASYSELYFDSEKMPMRTHFKCSSFSSEQPPSSESNTEDGATVNDKFPGRAELVRWEFYDKASQPMNDPNRKGDVMRLWFGGQNTNWSAADHALIDTTGYLVMGMATYCAHPMTYKFQNMIYPCKPDANGMPTRERLLIPTNKLIRSWVTWERNSVVNGQGQYDGKMRWWLAIDGIHGGEPFLAAAVNDFMWTTGEDLVIKSGGVGAYFNTKDTPKQTNQFYVLKDIIWYKAI